METTTNGLRYPDASDPATIWTYFQYLATDTDQFVSDQTSRSAQLPGGDTTNSVVLTGNDVRVAQSSTTNLITSTFTLTNDQYVGIAAKARFEADSTSTAVGDVGISIQIDGTVGNGLASGDQGLAQAGPLHVPTAANQGRVSLNIPTFSVLLTAGSHTVILQADRDSTGVVNASANAAINGRTYHPTSLTITV